MPQVESRLKSLMLLSLGGDHTAYRGLLFELWVRLRAYYRKRLGRAGRPSCECERESQFQRRRTMLAHR